MKAYNPVGNLSIALAEGPGQPAPDGGTPTVYLGTQSQSLWNFGLRK